MAEAAIAEQYHPMDGDEDGGAEPVDSQFFQMDVAPAKNQKKAPVGALSYIGFWWVLPILWKAQREEGLSKKDLYTLDDSFRAKHVGDIFEKRWEAELKNQKRKPSLFRVLFAQGWGSAIPWIVLTWVLYFVRCVTLIVQPVFFLQILAFFVDESQEPAVGYGYAIALLAVTILYSLFEHSHQWNSQLSEIRIRGALMSAVYKKALKISGDNQEWVTAMSIDVENIRLFMEIVGPLTLLVLDIVGIIVFLYFLVGFATFAGLLILASSVFFSRFTGIYIARSGRAKAKVTGERSKLLAEIFVGMKAIKYYAWETEFIRKVLDVRKDEFKLLRVMSNWIIASTSTTLGSPIIVTIVIFILSAVEFGGLSIVTLFPALILLGMLRSILFNLPKYQAKYVQAKVSFKRLTSFFQLPELPKKDYYCSDVPHGAIEVKDGNFAWDSKSDKKLPKTGGSSMELLNRSPSGGDDESDEENRGKLMDIQFRADPGKIVSIVGEVGSGKTSLILALLGEIPKVSGTVKSNGSIAYVPQKPWILNATVRDNILFGNPFDAARYDEVLRVCCLQPDMLLLENGDETWIGDRGINLSGGQKQRVSIARAIYHNADIYVFDDPLSAVDAHVGRDLFFDCIKSPMMSSKTRVLVTNQTQFVSETDYIVKLHEGKIVSQGPVTPELLESLHLDQIALKKKVKKPRKPTKPKLKKKASKMVIQVDYDQKLTVTVPSASIEGLPSKPKSHPHPHSQSQNMTHLPPKQSFIRSLINFVVAHGGFWYFFVNFIVELGAILGIIGMYIVLGIWAINGIPSFSFGDYVGVFVGFSVFYTVCQFLRSLFFSRSGLATAKKLHSALVHRVFRAPMSFFDVTPTGEVLGWFTKDMTLMDINLHTTDEMTYTMLFASATSLIFIPTVFPYALIFFVPLVAFWVSLARYYSTGMKSVKKLDADTSPPIYSQFAETLEGLSSVRAYQAETVFSEVSQRKVDANNQAVFHLFSLEHWAGVNVDISGGMVSFMLSLMIVASRDHSGVTVDYNSPLFSGAAMAALSLYLSTTITTTTNMLMSNIIDTARLLSVYHKLRWLCKLPTEAAPIVEGNRPPKGWPSQGNVVFKDFVLRYREDADPVLREISCSVEAKEKVGIVGRTGAGKSSLVSALFRLVEPSSGTICIDGVDITSIGLDDLRSNLSIISQDPVLFSGTVRSNLDPFNHYSDEEVWRAIELAQLADMVRKLPGELGAEVTANGENFSAGQRQQFSLARALLRRSKVFCLDEATSSIDNDTDVLIQSAVRASCGDVTVLTIAHRLNTIMDSDRVLVLDKGRIVEFDKPSVLLKDPKSYFTGMVEATGPTTAKKLRSMVKH